jgi:hypothetical protein
VIRMSCSFRYGVARKSCLVFVTFFFSVTLFSCKVIKVKYYEKENSIPALPKPIKLKNGPYEV